MPINKANYEYGAGVQNIVNLQSQYAVEHSVYTFIVPIFTMCPR